MCGHRTHHHRGHRQGDEAGLVPVAPEVRVADADRERVVAALRTHAGEGRLDPGELGERVDGAVAARTPGDLAALTADLPVPPRDPVARAKAWGAEARTFVWVVALLWVVWLATGAGFPWPVFPTLGWGVPLLLSRPRAGGPGLGRVAVGR